MNGEYLKGGEKGDEQEIVRLVFSIHHSVYLTYDANFFHGSSCLTLVVEKVSSHTLTEFIIQM